jgi:hypothetical protein
MAKVVTENFRIESADEFVDSFKTSTGNSYYIMGSSVTRDSIIRNTQKDIREFQRRVLFGNKVTDDDVRYMFNINPWTTGTVYDAFDDDADMSTKNFYVTVLPGTINETDYYVFKCISNNGGAPSTKTPSTANIQSDANFEVTLGDGYIWKYMFNVPPAEYLLFGTSKFLPYVESASDTSPANTAIQGISNIIVEQTDAGAFKPYLIGSSTAPTVAEVKLVSNSVVEGEIELQIKCESVVRNDRGAYNNMYLRSITTGEVYDIIDSVIPGGADQTQNRTLILTVPSTENLQSLIETAVEIVPKIDVSVPESPIGTRAIAYGILDNLGTLMDIKFRTKGSGYTYAEAVVKQPPALNLIQTKIKTVVSPRGGHGADPVHELFMSRVATVTSFYSDALNAIPNTNTYTKVGLVKNPTFANDQLPETFDNRVKLIVQQSPAAVLSDLQASVGNFVIQEIGGQTVTGIIHEIEYSGTDTILHLADSTGAYANKFQQGGIEIKTTLESPTSNFVGDINIDDDPNDIQQQPYSAYTGELLHFIDFDVITRTENSKEKIKLIFDF